MILLTVRTVKKKYSFIFSILLLNACSEQNQQNKMTTCTCQQRLDHSFVYSTRFRWLSSKQRYERYRRRECDVCGNRFTTVEIDRQEYDILLEKSEVYEQVISKAKQFDIMKAKAEKIKRLIAKTKEF